MIENRPSFIEKLLKKVVSNTKEKPSKPNRPARRSLEVKTVFMGSAEPPKPKSLLTERKHDAPTPGDEKLIDTTNIAKLKTIRNDPDRVIDEAIEKSKFIATLIGTKPLQNEQLKAIVSRAIVEGDSLSEFGARVRKAIEDRSIQGVGEAHSMLVRLSGLSGKPEVFPVRGAAWTFYDAARPRAARSARVQRRLQEIQTKINNDPALVDDPHFLESQAKQLNDPRLPSSEIREYIQDLRTRQREVTERIQRQREEDQRFSEFHLTLGEEEAMVLTPEWEIEEKLRKIEETTVLFPEGPTAEAATHRLRLMNSYFQNKQYERDVVAYMNRQGMMGAQRDNFYSERVQRFRELSDKVNIRTSIHRVYGMIRGVGDPEQIWKTLMTVGTRGFEHLLNENGGLNEVAFNKYVTLYKLARFDNATGQLQRILPETIQKIRTEVAKQMLQDKELYIDRYHSVYPSRDFKDEDCLAIVRQAEFAVVMSQQDVVAMLGALGPGEGGDFSSFLSTNTGEKILSAMDINRWFFEKWTNLSPGQRLIWENACRIAAENTGKLEYIQNRLSNIQRGTAEFTELANEFFGNEKNLPDLLRIDNQGKELKNIPKTFGELTLEQLRDRMVVVEGEKIVGELLATYDHYSSGWRISTHLEQLKRMYGYHDKLALGMRLKHAGSKWLGVASAVENSAEKKAAAANEVREVLTTISDYRPQAIFEALMDAKDKDATGWFQNQQVQNKLDQATLGEDVSSIDKFHGYIARRFLNINEVLSEEGLPPIDYSGKTPLSADQQRIIERVCGQYADNFKTLMGDLNQFVSGGMNIDKLVTEKYDKFYYRTLWIDDARLSYLEKPLKTKRTEFGTGGADYNMPLSELFTERGTSDVDPLVRTWRDASVAIKTVQDVYAALSPDRRTFIEKMVAIKENVDTYSGKVPAFRAVLYLLGGWGQTAKTDQVYDWLFLGNLQNTSGMKRLFGDTAPSLGLNELEAFMDEHDALLKSRMKLIAPETHAHVEKFLGITFSSDEKLSERYRRLPLYLYRSRLYIGIAAILITLQASKIADETLSGSSSKSS